jgi:hypothetical protein
MQWRFLLLAKEHQSRTIDEANATAGVSDRNGARGTVDGIGFADGAVHAEMPARPSESALQGLAKNTALLQTLSSLANLWMARKWWY